MLTDAAISTILPVSDMSRAAAFYRDRLGLQDLGDVASGNHVLQTRSGSTIELMAAEDGAQSTHTVATFGVPDLPAEITDLEGKGVRFDDYDIPGLTTSDHIATNGSDRMAWFSDTEGNILCLHEENTA